MSNQSSTTNNPPHSHLQSDRIRFPFASAQFAAATAAGYHPRPQTSAPIPPLPSAVNTDNRPPQASAMSEPTQELAIAYLKAIDERKSLQPPAAQPMDLDNFKGLKFVSLISTHENNTKYDDISGTFKWESCATDTDHCVKFIQEECANKRVFFVASGGYGKEVVPKIHQLPQVYAIYIFCADIKYHLSWALNYTKVRVVCNDDIHYLLPQLAVDVAQANIEWGDALLQKGKRDKAKEKYDKALLNLNKYANKPDPNMISQVTAKLDQCK